MSVDLEHVWSTVDPMLIAMILGLVEGVTEFLPVSSTGHLIIAGDVMHFSGDRANTFAIFIQLGAVLAVVWHYRARLLEVGKGVGGPEGRAFVLPLLVAFLPAALVGLLFHDWIKAVLFTPLIVAGALIVGGIAILLLERLHATDRITDAGRMPLRTALGIGLAQVLALVPGTSRSAATILGGFALGCSRAAATEFSFFLAIPVLGAATVYDLYESRALFSTDDLAFFAVGTATAFVTALLVIRGFLRFVSSRDFRPFAWYRIGFGLLLAAYYWNR